MLKTNHSIIRLGLDDIHVATMTEPLVFLRTKESIRLHRRKAVDESAVFGQLGLSAGIGQ